MFFGKMQSFYRRNSIHHQSPSHGSQSKPKDHFRRVKHLNDTEDDEDEHSKRNNSVRRRSFSISRNTEYDEPVDNYNRIDIPIIKIGLYEPETTKKSNILKEKEKALWYNSCPDPDDNSERLGPNKNNIIEESLGSDRKQNRDDD